MKKVSTYKSEKIPEKLTCPLCKKQVTTEQTRLPQIISWLRLHYNLEPDTLVGKARNGNFNNWACSYCEAKGKAVFPDYSKQNHGYGGPIYMYMDKTFRCDTCKDEFTFAASEQKYWYEDMKFNTNAFPKNCLSCRKKIRYPKALNKKLGELLNVEVKTAEVLKEIADLYKELGITDKANVFYARSKNKK